jgi:hypothetical protein
MPHPTILVLSQILTSTLSTDPSVAELLRRQATFLEDDTLPADLKERGAANFHHALFTETPNAIRAGDKVVEVLRRTIIAVGSLYLGMEREKTQTEIQRATAPASMCAMPRARQSAKSLPSDQDAKS